MRLQCSQLARLALIAIVIPGQKTEASARAIMEVVPDRLSGVPKVCIAVSSVG